MNESHVAALLRALTDDATTRRGLARGLGGLAIAAGLLHVGLDDLEAKKRKKGKKRRRRGRGNNGGNGGDNGGDGNGGGGGSDQCPFTICDGQCVDLNTDPNNCGFCGGICASDNTCVGGACVEVVGEPGSGEGQFDTPIGVAITAQGVEIATDSLNGRVVFLAGGLFTDFGFNQPAGIAINQTTSEVYVTDVVSHSILRFTEGGELIDEFGSLGSGVDQFETPSAIAIDQQGGGQIFIADTGNNRIQRTSETGFALGRFGRFGAGQGEFNQPEGVAISADRTVFVADTGNNRIQVLDRDGTFISAFGSAGSGPGQFNLPSGLAFAANGNLFVVDKRNNRVQEFTAQGQFVSTFGSAGGAPGQFNQPTGIAIDDDNFYVVDSGNNRVQIFFPTDRATE
jgi:DNA-binding beta-propeller fold protein YncE